MSTGAQEMTGLPTLLMFDWRSCNDAECRYLISTSVVPHYNRGMLDTEETESLLSNAYCLQGIYAPIEHTINSLTGCMSLV